MQLRMLALLTEQDLTSAQVLDFEPSRLGAFQHFREVLVPAAFIAALLYLYWLGATYLARRFHANIRWRVVRRWWPLAMAALTLPFALQNAGVLPNGLAIDIAAVFGFLLNLPVLLPLGLLCEATGFGLYGWASALWPATAWLGWQWLVRIVQRRVEDDRPVSLGI